MSTPSLFDWLFTSSVCDELVSTPFLIHNDFWLWTRATTRTSMASNGNIPCSISVIPKSLFQSQEGMQDKILKEPFRIPSCLFQAHNDSETQNSQEKNQGNLSNRESPNYLDIVNEALSILDDIQTDSTVKQGTTMEATSDDKSKKSNSSSWEGFFSFIKNTTIAFMHLVLSPLRFGLWRRLQIPCTIPTGRIRSNRK